MRKLGMRLCSALSHWGALTYLIVQMNCGEKKICDLENKQKRRGGGAKV